MPTLDDACDAIARQATARITEILDEGGELDIVMEFVSDVIATANDRIAWLRRGSARAA